MKRLLLCLVSSILFISCGSYQHSSYEIKSLLAITEAGDTIAVSIKDFERNKYDSYTKFRYNDAWYYNSWRYDFNWRWQQPSSAIQVSTGGITIFVILFLAGVIAHLLDRRFNLRELDQE